MAHRHLRIVGNRLAQYVHQLFAASNLERVTPEVHLVEDNPDAPYIHTLIVLISGQDLGGQIHGSATKSTSQSAVLIDAPPEITYLENALSYIEFTSWLRMFYGLRSLWITAQVCRQAMPSQICRVIEEHSNYVIGLACLVMYSLKCPSKAHYSRMQKCCRSSKKPQTLIMLGWLAKDCIFIYLISCYSMLFYLIIRFDTIFIAHIILLSLYTPSTTRPNVPLPSSFRIMKLYILKLTLRGKGVWSMLLLWLLLRIKDGGVFLICQFSDCFRRMCVLGRLVMFSDISSALGVSEELVAIDSWKLLFYCQAVLFFFITRAYTALSLLPEFFLSYFEKPNNSVLKLNFLFCKKLAERLVYSLELPS